MNMPGIPLPTDLAPPPDIQYATFSDEINQTTAGKFIHWLSLISNDRPRHNAVHLLFNSTGGMIMDAINMHNYVRGYPDLTDLLYQVGC